MAGLVQQPGARGERRASSRATLNCQRRDGNAFDLVVPKAKAYLAERSLQRQAEGRARAASRRPCHRCDEHR